MFPVQVCGVLCVQRQQFLDFLIRAFSNVLLLISSSERLSMNFFSSPTKMDVLYTEAHLLHRFQIQLFTSSSDDSLSGYGAPLKPVYGWSSRPASLELSQKLVYEAVALETESAQLTSLSTLFCNVVSGGIIRYSGCRLLQRCLASLKEQGSTLAK